MTEEILIAFNESVIKTLGKVKLKIKINGDLRWIEFIVVEKLCPYVIGGVNLQKQSGITLTKDISKDYQTDNFYAK